MIYLRLPSVLAGLEANVTSVLSESKKLATCEVTELYSEQSVSLKPQLSDLEFSALTGGVSLLVADTVRTQHLPLCKPYSTL